MIFNLKLSRDLLFPQVVFPTPWQHGFLPFSSLAQHHHLPPCCQQVASLLLSTEKTGTIGRGSPLPAALPRLARPVPTRASLPPRWASCPPPAQSKPFPVLCSRSGHTLPPSEGGLWWLTSHTVSSPLTENSPHVSTAPWHLTHWPPPLPPTPTTIFLLSFPARLTPLLTLAICLIPHPLPSASLSAPDCPGCSWFLCHWFLQGYSYNLSLHSEDDLTC